jgi:hypothetical protein
MPTDHRARLAKIRRFDQLVVYLREEMSWPIDSDDFEELTFEYTPEELGIDAKSAAKIQEIKRLRPLVAKQPWGIFFVKFEPKRLPVVALRRILGQVVLKTRASANKAERQAWAADDLLFVSNYGEGEERRIAFAHFSKPHDGQDLPTLKVLGWDNLDTPLHLDDVARELTAHLAWPDDVDDPDAWRERWRAAFTLRHREVITTSKQLSERLAELARVIRDRIKTALAIETETGPLTKLMKAFQTALVHDLDEAGFADMYAQTIAYGLLSARIADPHSKTAGDFAAHMRTNPFLKELMETFLHVGGRRGKAGGPGIDFDELGVSEVVDLLDRANMEAVVRDFGDRNPQEDPVIHFYEHFLAAYDKKQKVSRGVFYTPRPVVSYIVRSVDELLRTEFGLEDGLADVTTWGEMAKRHEDLRIPDGTSPDQAFVQILDPATGTGTFLVEVIDLIHKATVEKWKAQGLGEKKIHALWNEYVPKHLLPRLHGYELLAAPYAIAHLKIGLKLYESGYRFESEERARVYLTNALEPAGSTQLTLEFLPALAHEAEAVNEVKRNHRFTVVIGNPPYANYSANLSARARSLVDKYRSFAGEPIRERNQLQFERNLQDDFVKFISIAEDEVASSAAGVLGFITNATMLASMSLRGMREHLAGEFTSLHELQLHGGTNEIGARAGRDQNVFDIEQAVGIHVYVRRVPVDCRGRILFGELWGSRDLKYAHLGSSTVSHEEWTLISLEAESCAFCPQDEASETATLRIDKVFARFGAGVKTNRDAIAIAFTKAELLDAVKSFSPILVAGHGCVGSVQRILYRPFDMRWIFYHQETVASRSLPTMQHVIGRPNLGLVASSTWTSPERFSVNVSDSIVEMKAGTHDRGTTFFPLYLYDRILEGEAQKAHNFRAEFLARWERDTGAALVDPEEVFFWLYALLHSQEYRCRYRARLSQAFPILLFPNSEELLSRVASIGEELVALHLLNSPRLDDTISEYSGPTSPEVGRVGWSDGTVWLDAGRTNAREGHRATRSGTIGVKGVPEAVWDFHIGGYQVCHKWLKDRKGRTLWAEDIAHYQKIIVALKETIRIMAEIDEVIEAHGGWPGAFQTGSEPKSTTAETRRVIPFPPRTVEPRPEDRYVSCLPLVPLKAAAGAFSDPQQVKDDDFEWVEVASRHRLRKGMFAAQVVGKSMEPTIPDGAWCLFRAPVEGTRQGKTVLVQLRDATDPETGQRYTVKRYRSEKAAAGDSWRHERITLEPVNADFELIVLTGADEGELQVIAELVEVLERKASAGKG